jgi:glyoxylase-like metal-dependent hydrolase (beta-lactamase superfamily II)
MGERRIEMSLEIMPNLWQVGGGDLTAPGDAAAYLIRFGEGAALIDAGCGEGHKALKRNIDQALPPSVRLQWLLLTHCHFDHTGGARAVRDAFGCRIVAHALDAVYLEQGDSDVTAASWYGAQMQPLPIDVKLAGAENTVKVGDGRLEAIHWPGHSPGSLVFTTTLESQLVLFGQDVHGPIHASLLSDEKRYRQSLKKILELDADLLLEGHYGVLRGKEKVRDFIRSFMG